MKRIALSICVLALCAAPASAQEDLLAACADMQIAYSPAPPPPSAERTQAENQARFLCGQVVNVLTNVQPSVGIAFSGGAHTLGTATTIGRRLGLFPRISLTARVNGAFADVPELLDDYSAELNNGEIPPMGTTGAPVGSFQGDVTLGIYNGLSLGPALGGLGSIDLLGSVSFIPAIDQAGLTEEIINWGLGARVGLLKQGLVMPGLSVSGMYRNMGEVSFGTIEDGDPAEFATDLSTISLRAALSKGILMLDFLAGAGYDIYSSDVRFDWEVTCPAFECGGNPTDVTLRPTEAIEGELQTAAWNVYGNVGLSLLLFNIVGEVGYQKATEVLDVEDLDEAGVPREPNQGLTVEDLDGGRLFGSLGLRFTF